MNLSNEGSSTWTQIPTKFQTGNGIYPSNSTSNIGNSSYRYNNIYLMNAPNVLSDRDYKTDIKDTEFGLDFINKLRPVSYKLKDGESNRIHNGFIAQEIGDVIGADPITHLSDVAIYTYTSEYQNKIYDVDETGKHLDTFTYETVKGRYGLRYTELIGPLCKAIQELSNKIENNTVVSGETFITQTTPNAVNSSYSDTQNKRVLDDLIGRVFSLENTKPIQSNSSDMIEESDGGNTDMISMLVERNHNLETNYNKLGFL